MSILRNLAFKPPANIARELAGEDGFVWLDSELGKGPRARWSIISALPHETVNVEDCAATLFERLRARLIPGQADNTGRECPFKGGWIGFLDYGFGAQFMEWKSRHQPAGSAVFGFYPAALVWDHETGWCGLVTMADTSEASGISGKLIAAHDRARPGSAPLERPAALGWHPTEPQSAYLDKISEIQAFISAGDIYQANLSQRFEADLPSGLTPFEHYLSIRAANPAPFSAYVSLGGRTIGSTSPERFISVTGTTAEARPIKGTIAASADPDEDRALQAALQNSSKDRAENIMIVDLLRNDFSRVCRPHSVMTPEICSLESYEGLHHLVSSVTGTLKPGHDALDLLAAAFPGGSITGAPKLRAMEIIDTLEDHARGPYCGTIGYLSVDGTLDLSIAIRTLVYEEGKAQLNVGGGITLRSDPAAEYHETLIKAAQLVGPGRP